MMGPGSGSYQKSHAEKPHPDLNRRAMAEESTGDKRPRAGPGTMLRKFQTCCQWGEKGMGP